MANQYAERDASELDEVGGYYIRHVSAMTKEGLHGKGDIAAELGFRDMQIDALTKQRDDLLAALEDLHNGYVFVLEAGRYRIMDLGGQCDPVDVMETGDPRLASARAVIAKAKGGAA